MALDDVDDDERGVAAWLRPATCVLATAPLATVAALLASAAVTAVPVVTVDGVLDGIVTRADLLAAGERGPARLVGDVMMSFAFALPVSATIEQAAALMAYEGVGHLVIVTAEGHVVGLVGALDIARRVARAAGYFVDR